MFRCAKSKEIIFPTGKQQCTLNVFNYFPFAIFDNIYFSLWQPTSTYQQPGHTTNQSQPQSQPQSLSSEMEQMQLNGSTSPRQPPQMQPISQPSRGNNYPQMPYQNVTKMNFFFYCLSFYWIKCKCIINKLSIFYLQQSNPNDSNTLNKRLTVEVCYAFTCIENNIHITYFFTNVVYFW